MTMATTVNGTGGVNAPIAAPRIVRQRRMRPGLLGLAVLLIALGGLGAAFAVTSVRATGTYLAVARDVPAGSQLGPDDLAPVQLAGGQGLAPVPANQLDKVVGKRAAVRLTAGTLLTLTQVTDKPLLGPGQQQVAISLKRDAVPARTLHPGDKVLLVSTPARDADASGGGTRFDATVIDSAETDQTTRVLYLALTVRDVPAVVALQAQNRLAVVLVGSA
ncbi:SAF domain-containing protein [Plantactinospora sp. KBS50]|uniref:SAF domain-containing protein n=1 Tax=Plantactinospora sp. KBS50 TaxID=2024580 RepID=UPI000BAB1B14|nr:SAF domain-containing protein [Plantactinospora sp. KBS50]ASW53104.1 flagellar biosynthesis protein FlgA [Plantactinospora sp. KBS50]